MSGLEAAVVIAYYATLLTLATYGVHRLLLVRAARRAFTGGTGDATTTAAPGWPAVTVQIPLYNEPAVAARAVDAAAALRYEGRLEIQLLDDSTDETSGIIAARVAAARARGVEIEHVRRSSREGYKAGALAQGMALGRGELFAIFDADFVPSPDFLERVVPYFSHPNIGMVQTRWSHLNRRQSLLTQIQAAYLDAHFAVESFARYAGGHFFNFNGTAGVWRRRAIEEAGGWSASTLTEDLDLSYRAQLAGWKFVFLSDVEVPGEIPPTHGAFLNQQYRWSKGSLQTARKLLGPIFRAPLTLSTKVESFIHLTSNISYPMTLLLALLILPATLLRNRAGLGALVVADVILFAASSISVLSFYAEGQRHVGRPSLPARVALGLLPVGISLSAHLSSAVIAGLFVRGGEFQRTPKCGTASGGLPPDPKPRWPVAETIVFAFLIVATALLLPELRLGTLPFVMLFITGYGLSAWAGWSEVGRSTWRRENV